MSGFLRWLLQMVTYPLRALLYAPARILSGSRRLAGLSLPFQAAMLTLFVLLVSVAVTVVLFCRMNNVTFREAKLNSVFWLTTSLLVFLIPLVLYKALALWLEGPSSPYPDIDQAWKAGLRELQRKGLDLRQIPLFLVVGSTSEQQERAIFQSAAAEFLVSGAPEGNASLHWYAHADAVYLVASQACCLSGLGRNSSPAAESPPDRPAAAEGRRAAVDLRQTIPVGGMSRPIRPDAVRGGGPAAAPGPGAAAPQ